MTLARMRFALVHHVTLFNPGATLYDPRCISLRDDKVRASCRPYILSRQFEIGRFRWKPVCATAPQPDSG